MKSSTTLTKSTNFVAVAFLLPSSSSSHLVGGLLHDCEGELYKGNAKLGLNRGNYYEMKGRKDKSLMGQVQGFLFLGEKTYKMPPLQVQLLQCSQDHGQLQPAKHQLEA